MPAKQKQQRSKENMRPTLIACTLCVVAVAAVACNPAATTENANTTASTSTTTTTTTTTQPTQTGALPPISSAHGNSPAQPASAAPAANEQPSGVDTKALDAKIEKLEAKVKAGGTAADKKELAAAYLERGNIYYNAGQPQLYKFALGDLRRTLRYDPDNVEAKEKVDELVRIYNSLGRPVPTNGLEP
jgi:hypothetical protein